MECEYIYTKDTARNKRGDKCIVRPKDGSAFCAKHRQGPSLPRPIISKTNRPARPPVKVTKPTPHARAPKTVSFQERLAEAYPYVTPEYRQAANQYYQRVPEHSNPLIHSNPVFKKKTVDKNPTLSRRISEEAEEVDEADLPPVELDDSFNEIGILRNTSAAATASRERLLAACGGPAPPKPTSIPRSSEAPPRPSRLPERPPVSREIPEGQPVNSSSDIPKNNEDEEVKMSDVCDDLGISYEEICFLGCCHLLGAIEAVSSTPGYKEAMLSQKIFCKALEQTIAKRVDPTAVISSEKVLIVMAVGGLAVMKYKQFSGSPYIQVQNESESESESETDLTKTSFSNPATGTHSAFS